MKNPTFAPIGVHPDLMFFVTRDARRLALAAGYPETATEHDVPRELLLEAWDAAHDVHSAWCDARRPRGKLAFWRRYRVGAGDLTEIEAEEFL